MPSSDPRSDPPEPVPFSETTPEAEAPEAEAPEAEAPEAEAPEAEAPEAEAPEAGEGPEPPPPRPLQGKPSGTVHASAAPGPAPTGSARLGTRGQEAEPDDPLLHDLIAAHRLGEPAPVEARSAAREAGFEEMALEKK